MNRIQRARAAAEALLRKSGQYRCGVDVESIARHLDIPVIFKDLGRDVSGLLVTIPGDLTTRIVINKENATVRQRFSIAHEIGHAVLGHRFEPGAHVHVDRGAVVMQRGRRAASGVDPVEREANAFAAALLMPLDLVEQEVDAIEGDVITDCDVERMAEKFGVSAHAMQFHLQNLRLVS